jgi:hypothetical protein
MSKDKHQNNPDKVSKDAKEVIFLEGFKGETIENIIEYWDIVNTNNSETTLLENPKIKEAISVIKQELSKGSGGNTLSIKDLLK